MLEQVMTIPKHDKIKLIQKIKNFCNSQKQAVRLMIQLTYL